MLRKPLRLGGTGLRSLSETSLAAYIGGGEKTVIHCVGEGGICQQLGPVLDDIERPASMWQGMLFSGCRTGEEFAASWNTLRHEATESCQYLEKDLEGLLSAQVKGAGDASDDGSTRRRVTTWLEDKRAAELA